MYIIDVVNCYLSSWAKWRTGVGKFTIQDINPKLCTHITYAFIGLTSAGAIDPMGSTDGKFSIQIFLYMFILYIILCFHY